MDEGDIEKPDVHGTDVVSISGVDATVDEIVGWLREDIRANPGRFFGKFLEQDAETLLGMVDERFISSCKEILTIVIATRNAMAFSKHTAMNRDDCVFFVYEIFRTYWLHYGRTRDRGTSYFEEHLKGTVREAVLNIGICSRASVIAALKHDDREDGKRRFSDFSGRDLMDPLLYLHRIESPDKDTIARQIAEKVRTIVKGATGVKGGGDMARIKEEHGLTFEDGEEATFFQLLFEAQRDLHAVLVKLADRANNMKTIDGKSPDSQKRIAEQTERIYIPLARILQAKEILKDLIDCCAKVLNPPLHEAFHDLSGKRLTRGGDSGKDAIRSAVMPLGAVSDIDFVPFGIEHYVEDIDKDLGKISMDDLRISVMDPMQEIVVTVENFSDIRRVTNQLSSVLEFEDSRSLEYLRAPLVDSGTPVLSGDGTEVAEAETYEGKELPSFAQKGIVITGFSRKFGGQLRIRVNNKVSENRLKRGVLANSITTPSDIQSWISYLLDEKMRQKERVNVLKLAGENFLKLRAFFRTPHGDMHELPSGSTYLDAAALVHSLFLIGMRTHRGVYVSRSLLSQGCVDVNPFNELPIVRRDDRFPVLIFDSRLAGRKRPDESLLGDLEPDPGWLLFCGTDKARREILEYLRDPYKYLKIPIGSGPGIRDPVVAKRVMDVGQVYCERLDRVFGCDVVNIFASEFRIDVNDCYFKIGRGDIDPVKELAKRVPVRNVWHFEADIADKEGVYIQFLEDFRKLHLSVVTLGSKRIAAGSGDAAFDRSSFSVAHPGGDRSVDAYTVFKVLLKLSYNYEVRLCDKI